MRIMSVSKTKDQCYSFLKLTTRRTGWWNVKDGEVLQLVEKAQGLPRGAHVVKINKIQVISSRAERLDTLITQPEYGRLEMIREGFPDMTPMAFVDMFCEMNKCLPFEVVNRIDFRYYLTPAPDLILAVPKSITTCPVCHTQFTISPDGWYLDADGNMVCNSFASWCEQQSRKDDEFGLSHSKIIGMPYTYYIQRDINKWLEDTFRFEVGGAE